MSKMDLHVGIRIFCSGERSFGPGVAELLEKVDALHSLRKATAQMNMSYSKAWHIISNAEQAFGFPLLLTTIGGRDGGGAVLTDDARRVLACYRTLQSEVGAFARERGAALFEELREET